MCLSNPQKRTFSFLTLVLAITFVGMVILGCSQAAGGGSSGGGSLPVIISGSYSDGVKNIPCYWESTQPTALSGDSHDLSHGAGADGIWLSNGAVVAAGERYDGTKYVPCYWSGGARTDLSGDGTHDAEACGFAFDGSTVYVSGYWYDGSQCTPCYWAGKSRTDLSPSVGSWVPGAYALSVFLQGGAVYLGGYWNDIANGLIRGCIWYGTTSRTDLDGGTNWNISTVVSIFVSGSTVYGGGYWVAGSPWFSTPCYWTVTGSTIQRTDLPGGSVNPGSVYTTGAQVWGILESQGTVYCVGFYSDGVEYIPCYWVNGQKFNLTGKSKDGTHPATAYSAVISGGILYIAGVYYNGSQSVACYWTVNGSNISRTDLAGSNGWARGIALR